MAREPPRVTEESLGASTHDGGTVGRLLVTLDKVTASHVAASPFAKPKGLSCSRKGKNNNSPCPGCSPRRPFQLRPFLSLE
ncbi:hypothetical protein E2C01_066202 [Portunus trituberculatus]|uniref:Uncharacterized protein n=1 Tax=Portunus trituberculatus TaxID=210409 RepID=A0A5B7HHL3_PORTR|nr:hypothetical protein [Portunus trituberculatus]